MDPRPMATVTPSPLFSVVIPTLGNHDILWRMLEFLHQTDLSAAEVIVVFNGLLPDRKRVEDVLTSRFPNVRFLSAPEPYGIARANNLGARAAQGRFVAFLHDDVLIYEPRWLALLTDILERRSDVGMVGGSEPKYTDRTPAEAGELEPGVTECDWSPTLSVARRADLAVCSFDEFYRVGLEDKDWALTFRRRGQRVVCRKVAHEHIGTKGSYTLLLHNRSLLDYYSKEGVRERYFMTKNKDVLAEPFCRAGWKKWGRWDRDWRKTWWMKLYVHSFFLNLKFGRHCGGRGDLGQPNA
ncbi:MAG: glycosyltransferase [Elusimicrobia bacterium]|nr:glycosyltransferase [Elusimicrobiota bacterium]